MFCANNQHTYGRLESFLFLAFSEWNAALMKLSSSKSHLQIFSQEISFSVKVFPLSMLYEAGRQPLHSF
jgi:hypothetical protein